MAAEISLSQAESSREDEALDKVVDLIDYLVCSLVTDVDDVSLDVSAGEFAYLVEITTSEDDIGRVIGRKGRTIKAIRTLARALGTRVGVSVEVEVLG